MKSVFALFLVLATAAPTRLSAQASAIPSAAPVDPGGQNDEQRGKELLDEMVQALGGQAWLSRKDMQVSGRTAAFFRGAPNGTVIEYTGWRRFAASGEHEVGLAEADAVGRHRHGLQTR